MAKSKNQGTLHAGKDVKKGNTSLFLVGLQTYTTTLGINLTLSQKSKNSST